MYVREGPDENWGNARERRKNVHRMRESRRPGSRVLRKDPPDRKRVAGESPPPLPDLYSLMLRHSSTAASPVVPHLQTPQVRHLLIPALPPTVKRCAQCASALSEDFFNLSQFAGCERRTVQCASRVFYLLRPARADESRGDRRISEDPPERHLRE